ncbi:prepilin-type N-terminal cleavage/methylation domain-containing protein [Litoribrevibacter euphylliae]|uniref:Prepilin-type N-terminal cleavage/methylation domain-containing protein n=1 Tax=Litoribrevibacter euphylliae TaxID=1834034 RepID=A0ABV7HI86_9GAMM
MTFLKLNAQGMTLVEMVIAIAVAGIAIAGLAAAFSSIVTRTADPMIQTQAQVAAESLMEEILLKPFADPDSGNVCTDVEAARQDKDDVCDFHNYTSSGVEDQTGTATSGLENYTVSVTVTFSDFGGITIADADALLVTVAVTSPLGADVVLSAYRTNY